MRVLRTLPILLLLPLVPACYAYVPTERAQAPRGGDVRTHITATAVERFGPMLPQGGPSTVEGRLVDWNEDALVLEISERITGSPVPSRNLTQTVRIASEEVVTVQVKTLDRLRTLGLATVIAGAVVATVIQALSGVDGGDPPSPPPPGPTELRVPAPTLQPAVP